MDIVCLGEVLIDMFPGQIGQRMGEVTAFLPKPGGAPANVAVAASRLGRKTAFIGKVGNDAFGERLIHVLDSEGVETGGMRVDAQARTTMAFIAMPDAHTAEFVFYRNPGADMMLRADELEQDLLSSTKAFHFGSISLIHEPSRSATQRALQMARDSGALISFDVNFRPSLWAATDEAVAMITRMIPEADVVKVNELELEILSDTNDLAKGSAKVLAMGVDLCVVTRGAEGSCFRTSEGFDCVDPFTVDTVDSVGCGDAFTAGLLTRLTGSGRWRDELALERLRRHLRFANAVGALTAQKKGVIPALPTTGEVKWFLRIMS